MSTKYKTDNIDGIYFLSCATVEWTDVFTRPVYKKLFVNNLNYCIVNKGLEIFAWVLMTNHFHLLARSNDKERNLNQLIGDFKKYVSKKIREEIETSLNESRRENLLEILHRNGFQNSNNDKFQFWQQDNHPIEIKSNEMLTQKINYIHENPVRQEIVANPQDYIYSSAMDYSTDNFKGLIKIIYAY